MRRQAGRKAALGGLAKARSILGSSPRTFRSGEPDGRNVRRAPAVGLSDLAVYPRLNGARVCGQVGHGPNLAGRFFARQAFDIEQPLQHRPGAPGRQTTHPGRWRIANSCAMASPVESQHMHPGLPQAIRQTGNIRQMV